MLAAVRHTVIEKVVVEHRVVIVEEIGVSSSPAGHHCHYAGLRLLIGFGVASLRQTPGSSRMVEDGRSTEPKGSSEFKFLLPRYVEMRS
jgi:hypothetical protein